MWVRPGAVNGCHCRRYIPAGHYATVGTPEIDVSGLAIHSNSGVRWDIAGGVEPVLLSGRKRLVKKRTKGIRARG